MERFRIEDLGEETRNLVHRIEVVGIHYGGCVTWVNEERHVAVVVHISADPDDGYSEKTRELNVNLLKNEDWRPYRERTIGLPNGREPMKYLDMDDLMEDARKALERMEGFVRSEGGEVAFLETDRGFCAVIAVLDEGFRVPRSLRLVN